MSYCYLEGLETHLTSQLDWPEDLDWKFDHVSHEALVQVLGGLLLEVPDVRDVIGGVSVFVT